MSPQVENAHENKDCSKVVFFQNTLEFANVSNILLLQFKLSIAIQCTMWEYMGNGQSYD
jgi:hypothetical protein